MLVILQTRFYKRSDCVNFLPNLTACICIKHLFLAK
ncbi:hypothetical protein MHA_1129 [Mannheimia haemolytica PHL213]|nr:hypothetical protein MHA_1129 [Mannheimia haemolytica PHL213]